MQSSNERETSKQEVAIVSSFLANISLNFKIKAFLAVECKRS